MPDFPSDIIDPNPGRATPRGGRAYPLDAAGTALGNGALILSGDDAGKFRAAGYNVAQFYVQCSAKIEAGEYDAPEGQVIVAIDCNGQPWETVAETALLADARPATGIYNGATTRSVVGYMDARDVPWAHRELKRHVSGFECFAVMS